MIDCASVTDEQIADSIRSGAAELSQELLPGEASRLAVLLSELARWGGRINLTAILDRDEMVSAHVLDSLSIRSMLEGEQIIDVGTGAGFPGLPLAIVEPDRIFTLLDSSGKKISFVQHMVGTLGLTNVTAVKARAEDYAPEARFDTVIARALASMPRLLEFAGHLVREGGVMLAQKGKDPAAELEAIRDIPGWDMTISALTVPGLASHQRHVVILRRTGKTE